MVLIVGQNSPYKTPQDVLAATKAKPKTISSASAGSGTSQHLALELLGFKSGSKILQQPEMQERLKALGMQPSNMTTDEVSTFQKAEVEKWAQVIKAAGVKLE